MSTPSQLSTPSLPISLFQSQLNGTANVTAVEQCAAAGVPRFVFLSAQIPQVPGIGE